LFRRLETLLPGAEARSLFTNENEAAARSEYKEQYKVNELEYDFKRITGRNLREMVTKAISDDSTVNLDLPSGDPVQHSTPMPSPQGYTLAGIGLVGNPEDYQFSSDEGLLAKCTTLESENVQLREKLKSTELALKTVKDDFASVVKRHTDERMATGNEHMDLKEQVARLEVELNEAKNNTEKAEANLVSREDELKKLQVDIEELEKNVRQKEQELTTIKNKITHTSGDFSKKEGELNRVLIENARLEAELDRARDFTAAAVNEIRDDLIKDLALRDDLLEEQNQKIVALMDDLNAAQNDQGDLLHATGKQIGMASQAGGGGVKGENLGDLFAQINEDNSTLYRGSVAHEHAVESVIKYNYIGVPVQTEIRIPPGETRSAMQMEGFLKDPVMASIDILGATDSQLPGIIEATETMEVGCQTTETFLGPATIVENVAQQGLQEYLPPDFHISPEKLPHPTDAPAPSATELAQEAATGEPSSIRPPEAPPPLQQTPGPLGGPNSAEHIRLQFENFATTGPAAPAPESMTSELIQCSFEERNRLDILRDRSILNLEDAQFVLDFITSQSQNPTRFLLKTLFGLSFRVNIALRKPNGDKYIMAQHGRGDLLGWRNTIHSPLGIFAWPWKMLVGLVNPLDSADYIAASSASEDYLLDAIKKEILEEAQGANDPYPPARAPVGITADLLRAGPKPAQAWGLLTAVLWFMLIFLLVKNWGMYAAMVRDQDFWARANGEFHTSGGVGGGCRVVCGDGWGWRWRAVLGEWANKEVGW
jgi:predicted  nucleic acid-binding Zn-ribbon protein